MTSRQSISSYVTGVGNGAATAKGRDWPIVLLLWLMVAGSMLYGYSHQIAILQLGDPDDALRLVQVRDLLAGQNWYDLTQYRINPADGGGQLHWSRFIDAQIAGLILLFQKFLPAVEAERWAVALYPLLLILPLLLIFQRILAQLGDRMFVFAGLFAAATNFSFLHYFTPMRIDHHNWQLLLSVAMLWLALGRATFARGLVAALVISMHVEISLEGLPYLVIFGGLFALDWLRDPETAPRLRGFALGLGVLTPVWIALWRGVDALTGVYCDAFSRPFAAGAVVTGLIVAAAMAFPRLTDGRVRKIAVLGVAGAAGGLAFILSGPACMAGPFGNLSTLVRIFWYEGVMEGQAIWDLPTSVQVTALAPTIIGFAGMIWSARQMVGTPRALNWMRTILVSMGSIFLSLLVLRTTSTAHAYLVVGHALIILAIFNWGRRLPTAIQRIPATVACIVALPLSTLVASVAFMQHFGNDEKGKMPTDCITPAALQELRTLPPTTFFTALDFAPAILVGTEHKVIASGHHRNHRAIHRVLAAFLSVDPKAERLVRETGATHVAICRNLPEHLNYVKYGKKGLASALHNGTPPPWLVAEPQFSLGAMRIYRVLPKTQPVAGRDAASGAKPE